MNRTEILLCAIVAILVALTFVFDDAKMHDTIYALLVAYVLCAIAIKALRWWFLE